LRALRWSDVDFAGGCIRIRRSLSWARGVDDERPQARFGPTKTESGERDVPLYPGLAQVLREWKLRSSNSSDDDLVFSAPDGMPLRHTRLLKAGFQRALKRAGLRSVVFHSLRHSFASGLIMRGGPVTEVQRLLGHSDPGITLRVYSHWYEGAKSGAGGAYNDAIFGAAASS
jgi:integrase